MSYYEFKPHQIYSGVGCSCGLAGDFKFNGAQAWSDWQTCNTIYQSWAQSRKIAQEQGGPDPGGFRGDPSCNAVNDIRAALSQLGYGMGKGQGMTWGAADQSAMKQFCSDAGINCGTGMPTKTALLAMEDMIKQGEVPGDEPVPELKKTNGQYRTTGTKGLSTASMFAIGGAAVLLVGGLAMFAAKRPKGPKNGK